MPVKTYKVGQAGTLNLSSSLPFSYSLESQVRSMTVKVTEKVTTAPAIPVLSGEELEASEEVDYVFTLVGTVLQDIEQEGLTDFTWLHAGEEADFQFKPSNAGTNVTCSGVVVIAPLDFGGDVDDSKRPEAPINWRIIGTPTLG